MPQRHGVAEVALLDHCAVGPLKLDAVVAGPAQVLGPLEHDLLLALGRVADRRVADGPRVLFGHLGQRQVKVRNLPSFRRNADADEVLQVAPATAVADGHGPVALEDQVQRWIVQVALDPVDIADDGLVLLRVGLGQLDDLPVGPDRGRPVVVERQFEEEALPCSLFPSPSAVAAKLDQDAAAVDGHPLVVGDVGPGDLAVVRNRAEASLHLPPRDALDREVARLPALALDARVVDDDLTALHHVQPGVRIAQHHVGSLLDAPVLERHRPLHLGLADGPAQSKHHEHHGG